MGASPAERDLMTPQEKGDRATVVFAMLARAANGVAMTFVLVAALWRLSPVEQGLYFSFQSFGALIQLSEFGLSYAVLQTASHLVATGRRAAVHGLAARAMRRNAVTMAIAALVVGSVGYVLFTSRAEGHSIEWVAPWVAFVCAAVGAQCLSPLIAAREGSGSVREVWRFRLFYELVGGVVFAAALALELGLWSLTCFWCSRIATTALWLKIAPPTYRDDSHVEFSGREWRDEVWPFQWRIGLSYISGFFIFYSFAPIILSEQGPINAGRMGLTIGLLNMLLAVSTSWPQSQAARYGHMLSTGEMTELHRHFVSVSVRSTLLCVAGLVALSSGLAVWSALDMPYADRYADPATSALLLVSGAIHHAVVCIAVLLRAERREPFLLVSVIGGVVTAVGIWLSARYGTMRTVAVTNLFLTVGGLPIAYWLYVKRRRVWNARPDASDG